MCSVGVNARHPSDHYGKTRLGGVKKPGIVVHSLRYSTPTFALLNDANPMWVQRMMRHKHYATTEIYVEEVQKLLEGSKMW